jgi:hypothetical protein
LRLSVSELLLYGVALLFMKAIDIKLYTLILIFVSWGCSGVQERTAFAGGFKVPSPKHLNLLDSVNGAKQTSDLKIIEAPQIVEEKNKLTFSQKVEQHIHKRNKKVWFESGRLPQKVQKIKPIKEYKEFLKSGKTLAKAEGSKKGKTLAITGLILSLLGFLFLYFFVYTADNDWGFVSFSSLLLGLAVFILGCILLLIGLVMSFY